MFKESRDISKDPTSIVKGHDYSFYILNKEDKNHYFEVIINSSKRFYKYKSPKYYRFKLFSVCQHTLVVLDKINLLHTFLEKFQCAKSDIVISNLAVRSAGTKKRKATEKRKGPPKTKHIPLKSLVHHQSLKGFYTPNFFKKIIFGFLMFFDTLNYGESPYVIYFC